MRNQNLLLLVAAAAVLFLSLHASAHGGADPQPSPADPTAADGTSSPPVNLRSKSLITVKVLCLVILLVSTFLAGVSPYFFRWNESFLLLGTQFAGGVFLGTALMHFLGDANSTFEARTSKTYPFAFMLAAAGYLLTMLGDVIITTVIARSGARGGNNQERAAEDGRKVEEGGAVASAVAPAVSPTGLADYQFHPGMTAKTGSVGDTLLLILALCFHSVFEGIAVGVSDTKASAWRNLWTICLHKIFAAIAMGIALLRMLPKRPLATTAAYSAAFAVSSPIGVGIGIAIDATTEGATADWIFCISMGLACGVFIYVAINHLIAKGFRPSKPSYFDSATFKFLAVLTGVTVIAIVLIWD